MIWALTRGVSARARSGPGSRWCTEGMALNRCVTWVIPARIPSTVCPCVALEWPKEATTPDPASRRMISRLPDRSGATVIIRRAPRVSFRIFSSTSRDGSQMQAGWIMPGFSGEMKGPSRWRPSSRAPPRSAPVHSAATSRWRLSAPGRNMVVARNPVMPYRAQARAMAESASFVPSSVSAPPAPWMCTSISPGATSRPPASRTSPAGRLPAGPPMPRIFPFSMMRVERRSRSPAPGSLQLTMVLFRMGGIVDAGPDGCPACARRHYLLTCAGFRI